MDQKILIDNRKKEDVLEQMNGLSKSYVPEWSLDTQKPDIGTTLAYIYSSFVADNIDSINQIIDRYHTEFINLLDISVNPAIPAKSIVLMELAQDTIEGAYIPKGSRLLADNAGESVIFETSENVYITGSKIDNIFMTDREDGSISPILGEIPVPPITNTVIEESDEELSEEEIVPVAEAIEDGVLPQNLIKPFVLYGESAGVGKNVVMLYHSCIFDIENNDIYITIEGDDKLISDIESGRKYFVYATEGQLKNVESIRLMEDKKTFCIRKDGKNDRQLVDGKEYSMLALIDDGIIKEDVNVKDIVLSASGDAATPEYIGTQRIELESDDIMPFSDELALYDEFYIGFDEYFKKASSNINISFDVSYKERLLSITALSREEELKIIKKKPTVIMESAPVDVYVQQIAIEYFNGIGWKKLKTDIEMSRIFQESVAGKVSFSFVAPDDWDINTSGGYEGRMLRMQLLKADNCYMRPSIHHYPVLNNLKVSFSYAGCLIHPEKIKAISGTKLYDLKDAINKTEQIKLFRISDYDTDALFIGLSKRPVSGPVSIMIALEEGVRYDALECVYEYSTIDGFKTLKVVDGTYNMTRSGLVMFLPPADFAARTIEGNKKYWIRIRRKTISEDARLDSVLPHINNIALNGIVVENVETYPEQELYLDEVTVGAKFTLPQSKILNLDVWVNETSSLSTQAMKDMLNTDPSRCRAEYDILGNITSFYVLWDEVDRFDNALHKRVYELDRLTSTIIFGNGIDTEIPRTVGDVALIVKVKCCQGKSGNVAEYAINSSFGRLLYIGDIYNPVKGYGGSDMESVDNALIRGSNIISTRRRLVSRDDYTNEILAFSDRIDKVRCLIGENGFCDKEEGAITLILLMKDFMDGSFSFHEISEKLKAHIKERCSMTIPDNKLYLYEPLFVDVAVTLWVKAEKMQDAFEIQNSITEMLDEYLMPVSSNMSKGWKIGIMPTASQIQMKLNSNRHNAIIKNCSIVVSYTDNEGYHEMDINNLKIRHNMICRSGKHQIHVDI